MATKKETHLQISPPNMETGVFLIEGTEPYVQNKFGSGPRGEMHEKQEAGSTGKKGKKREKKDFQKCYEEAKHLSTDGWNGIPAAAFRCALISACRLCGFQMTRAKLVIFIEADGFDADDGTALVKITKGKPDYFEAPVRISMQTTDLRARPLWKAGWQAKVLVRFDADQFTLEDVANLMLRAGLQVGVGEGRPDSKTSAGQGWGLFKIIEGKVA